MVLLGLTTSREDGVDGCLRRKRLGRYLSVAACFLVLSIPTSGSSALARDAVNDAVRIRLEREHDRALAEKRHWERVITIQRELAHDPGRFAQAAEAASRELSANGRLLVVEGVTGGLSNVLKLQSAYAKAGKDKDAARQFKDASTALSSFHTLVIKDMVRSPKATWTPSTATNETIDKLNAALKLVILAGVRDPNVADGLNASLDLSKGLSGFLTAYLSGDEVRMKQLLPAVQGVLAGTLAMTKALAASQSPAELEGVAVAVAQRLPAFAPVAKMMATTALADFNMSLALANIGWGGYAMTNGFQLEAQAEEIRYNQARAVVTLTRLLPRARAEVARAAEEERRLAATLDALGPAPPRLPPVMPSTRFVDDAPRYTLAPASLPSTITAIQETPSLNIKITVRELDKRVGRQKEITRQEIEEARRRAEAAREAARAEARRIAAERRQWAGREDYENDRREAQIPNYDHTKDLEHVQEVINNIPRVNLNQ